VVDFWERLFESDESKDVTLEARDGYQVRAHGLLLMHLSEPLKCALTGGMQESRTKSIKMEAYTKQQLQFFLRLAYTGCMDKQDWVEEDAEDAAATATGAVAPASPLSQVSPISRDEMFQCGYEEDFADFFTPYSPPEEGVAWGPPDESCFISGREPPDPHSPPVELLLGCMSIVKKYDVAGFLPWVVENVKTVLTEENFEKVACAAVADDIAPLRIFCVNFARKRIGIKEKFQRAELPPELQFELQAIWTPPWTEHQKGEKRRRYM